MLNSFLTPIRTVPLILLLSIQQKYQRHVWKCSLRTKSPITPACFEELKNG